MKKLMKMMLMLALAASVNGAFAWDLTIPATNAAATTVMIVPPVVDASAWQQIPERSTGVVVAAGARYRIGRQIIVAAHAGTITNVNVTTTSYYTNGVPVVLAGAQWAATNGISVYTNSVTACAPITVPAAGISGYDGTVRWYRVRQASVDDVRMQLTISGSGETVTFTDGVGSTLDYTATAEKDFADFDGALYVSRVSTNACSIKAMAW